MIDIIDYCDKEQIPAIMISIDFEKCFDTIEFSAIEGALRYFGFGERFVTMILLLYTQFQTAIVHNGNISPFFTPTRAIHQGCALSGYIFLLNTEILAMKIQECKSIKRIPLIDQFINPVSQFVDDMCLFTLADGETLDSISNILESFEQHTGLKTNFEKTCIYHLGSVKDSSFQPKTTKNFRWADTKIMALGVLLDDSAQNYKEVFEKVTAILNTWKNRKISLIGKTVIINALIVLLFVYKMQVLPFIPDKLIRNFHQIITNFIWNGRKPEIRTEVLQALKVNAGLRLVDLRSRDVALKIAWVKRLIEMSPTDNSFMLAYYHIKPKIIFSEFWHLNVKEKHIDGVCNAKGFWKSISAAWSCLNFHHPKDIHEIIVQRL